jgi:UPF0716 family protein affecting phage T7 exclusion
MEIFIATVSLFMGGCGVYCIIIFLSINPGFISDIIGL